MVQESIILKLSENTLKRFTIMIVPDIFFIKLTHCNAGLQYFKSSKINRDKCLILSLIRLSININSEVPQKNN